MCVNQYIRERAGRIAGYRAIRSVDILMSRSAEANHGRPFNYTALIRADIRAGCGCRAGGVPLDARMSVAVLPVLPKSSVRYYLQEIDLWGNLGNALRIRKHETGGFSAGWSGHEKRCSFTSPHLLSEKGGPSRCTRPEKNRPRSAVPAGLRGQPSRTPESRRAQPTWHDVPGRSRGQRRSPSNQPKECRNVAES